MNAKRISPAVVSPLKEALTVSFWYKKDLRAFLAVALPESQLLTRLDWTDYKRNIVGQLVDTLARDQHLYFDDLLNLLLATSEITDPRHLTKLEDGERKYRDAIESLDVLKGQVDPYRKLRSEADGALRRRREDEARIAVQRAVSEKLAELKKLFYRILAEDPQRRGYSLERLVNDLFAVYDIDAKASFRVVGEQIDGAFSFEGAEFLFEAKWQQELVPSADLDVFAGKISRKLDNTLGLFLSMNGFQPTAIDLHSQNRSLMFLMDGADLSAVLEDRIALPDLLRRKRQHASRTGEVMLSAYSVLGA